MTQLAGFTEQEFALVWRSDGKNHDDRNAAGYPAVAGTQAQSAKSRRR